MATIKPKPQTEEDLKEKNEREVRRRGRIRSGKTPQEEAALENKYQEQVRSRQERASSMRAAITRVKAKEKEREWKKGRTGRETAESIKKRAMRRKAVEELKLKIAPVVKARKTLKRPDIGFIGPRSSPRTDLKVQEILKRAYPEHDTFFSESKNVLIQEEKKRKKKEYNKTRREKLKSTRVVTDSQLPSGKTPTPKPVSLEGDDRLGNKRKQKSYYIKTRVKVGGRDRNRGWQQRDERDKLKEEFKTKFAPVVKARKALKRQELQISNAPRSLKKDSKVQEILKRAYPEHDKFFSEASEQLKTEQHKKFGTKPIKFYSYTIYDPLKTPTENREIASKVLMGKTGSIQLNRTLKGLNVSGKKKKSTTRRTVGDEKIKFLVEQATSKYGTFFSEAKKALKRYGRRLR